MMATVHPTTSSLVPLLESLEDAAVGLAEQTDAYLTISNRLSGEDGKHFIPAVIKHFSRLGKLFQAHIGSPNVELSQAALQALGFCVFHAAIVSGISASFVEEILTTLNSIVVKSTDKNTCTRAMWVIAKQNFPPDVVSRKVPDILKTLEAVRSREDLQSVIMEHEALNVVIRLLEQTPGPMGEGAVQWARLVLPLVVHSASKVRLRAAAALEMGMPLLLQRQQEVAAIIEPIMSSKVIPELQKLFSSKNETNVLKLWPLFVRLLGKVLHRGGPFINSLLNLEELGFRSSSPIIKKIAFIAWKSLIDNFALNPEILCSVKRLKLLMQPLSSIHVRTEALLLTKLEVWWYLVVKLGPNLAVNFEQVAVPLLQIAVATDAPLLSVTTPSRNSSQNTSLATPKAGGLPFSTPGSALRMSLNSSSINSSSSSQPGFPSIQLLGLEMLLHYFLGSEVTAAAAKSKLQLSLEPLTHPFLTSPSSFTKHSGVLISAVRDSFISIGKDAPEASLTLIWESLIGFVSTAMETGSKKDRSGSEVLTLLLQALESIVSSEALPAQRTLGLLEATVKGIPRKILGSAAYQVANMDVLNGTPALFLILLFHHSSVLPCFVTDERFFLCLETLIGCGLSGPASPLAFSESVLGAMSRNAEAVQNREHLWRMWSAVANPLTDTITQTNEVNQGDALEHNYAALLRALMFPVTHLLIGHALPQMTQKSLLSTWTRLYRAFARCSALVATAEENVCCEELCAKMAAVLDSKALSNPSTLEAVASLLLVVVECVDFTPYSPHYQKTKSPHTPLGWVRKKSKALGNLSTFQALLVQALESFLSPLESFLSEGTPKTTAEGSAATPTAATPTAATGAVLLAILTALFSNLAQGTAVLAALTALSAPLARLCQQAGRPQTEQPKFFSGLGPKLEKLLGEVLGCLQTRSSLAFDDELLTLLAPLLGALLPHRSKSLRSLSAQFWNATFAHATTLTYPDDLKPVLSQVKQKIPIILPGFQAVDVPEEFSGQYSGECTQMETQISGVKIASVGKRDSLLSRTEELKDKGSGTPSKPVAQVKLDFGSPRLPRREVLEEEASMDFVFIPPQTKERVLTEHQKEVKRTKRVDIPAMYNNLDASLDTTAFTQYTQSQEESMDKLPASDEPDGLPEDEGQAQVQDEKMETGEPDVESNREDMDVGPVEGSTGDEVDQEERPGPPKEAEPKSEDGDSRKQDDLGAEETTKETSESGGEDCDVSASSDVVAGTPPKPNPNSRRQSFITLEKYVEGKPASPIGVTKFTGPHSRVSSSQDESPSQQKDEASEVPTEASTGVEAVEVAQEPGRHGKASEQQVSSQVKVEKKEPHPPVEEVEKHRRVVSTEDEDDIIPDTQAETDSAEAGRRETKASVPVKGDDSCVESMYDSSEDGYLNDSQGSEGSGSQSEIRRSSRRRSRPLRPGEDREEVEGRYQQIRKNVLSKGIKGDQHRPDSSPASQVKGQSPSQQGSQSKMAAEAPDVDVKERFRKPRASSQSASPQKAQNDSQSVGRVTRRKAAGPTEEEVSKTKSQTASSTPASQTDSESQGRSSRRNKVGGSAEEMSQTDLPMASSKDVDPTCRQSLERPSKRTKLSDTAEDMSQTETQVSLIAPVSQTDSQSSGSQSRRSKASGPAEEMSQTDGLANLSTPVTQTDSQLQGRPGRRSKVTGLPEEVNQTDSQASLPTPVSQTDSQSSGRPSRRSKASGPAEEMSQTDKQAKLSTPVSQTDSQSSGRSSRRSKVSGPPEEMSQSDSQASLSTPVGQTEVQSKGRPGRRSKASGPPEEMSQTDTKTSLSTPVSQTDGQSQGRPSRRSKPSGPQEEMSQTDTQASSSTPVSQTDSQSQGRLGRRGKTADSSAEMSQTDTQTGLSTLDQNNDQLQSGSTMNCKATDPTVEASQTNFHPALSTSSGQSDSQSQGRRSRRGEVSGPQEEVSQTDTQASLPTPVLQTDSQSRGRPRRSKSAGPQEEMSQTDTQASLPTTASQTDSQSQRRRSRRGEESGPPEEKSQTDTQASSSTPVSQTDSLSQGRPSRRSKISAPPEEKSQTDTQASSSTPVSQTDSLSQGRPSRRSKPSGPQEEMSQTDTQASSSTPVSQTDSQSQGRPSRRSKVSGPPEEMSQTDTQASLSTPVIRTDSQSQGTLSKRNETTADSKVGSSLCSANASESDQSQLTNEVEDTPMSLKDLSQYKTREYSQDLLTDIENSEVIVSETQDDNGQKSSKRGRKLKLLKSKATPPSPLKTQVPEASEEMDTIDATSEAEMEDRELHKNSESKSIPVDADTEAVEPSDEKENKKSSEIMVPGGALNLVAEPKAELKKVSGTFAEATSEVKEELSEPSAEPSSEIRDSAVDGQKVQMKRGRRSAHSDPKAAKAEDAPSQESDVSSCQGSDSRAPGEIAVSPAPSEPLSDAKSVCPQQESVLPQRREDASEANDDDVFLDANATLSECVPVASVSDGEGETWRTPMKAPAKDGRWSTGESESRSDVELPEAAEDMEDGQRQDVDAPQATDVPESDVDPAKELVEEEKSVMQEQGVNREGTRVSVQEQDAPEAVASEPVEEYRVPQIDSDVPSVAADASAVQALPEEPAAPHPVTAEAPCLDSPLKQKLLDSVAAEVGQSPASGKTKGVWSPSASPSTSILKKGQKRPLEVESPSPLPKSRRVSFADPIHHQELADDIDRRSPVIRQPSGSSPRSKNMAAVSSQQKFVTTPTKGLLTLSPRNLRSPGYKSSKKCLISEMSLEPKAIPRDCVYPALVSCSAPVEAVLPQISSNMWPRGFGQLVRARNIRTVGDLSALTPTEIKSLPIRSPKLSNVKKALRNYHEQQRKGRNDELKGFDEMEKMTSEPEEMEMAQHQEEGGKPLVEAVTDAESADVPAPPPASSEPSPVEQSGAELPAAAEALAARMSLGELGRCLPGQLVQLHEQLGGMMRAIVTELQSRLAPSPGESLP